MLARLQQFTSFVVLAIALASAGTLAERGQPLWAAVAFVAVASGSAIVLAVEFLLLPWVNRNDPAPTASAAQLLKAWWSEVLAATRVFCWQQPFRSRVQPDNLPSRADGTVGVVFVHGFVCNRGLWNPWLGRLRRVGVPFVAVDLEPVFGSIDDYVPIIERAVRRVEAATGARPLIVAHSMGGLAVRAWLDACHADARVRRVVTIGTPHRGTLMARFAPSRNASQMRPESGWQRALAAREPTARYQHFTCFYSHCDNIVVPASSSTLPGADNRHVSGVGHVDLARQATVLCEVLRQVGVAGPACLPEQIDGP